MARIISLCALLMAAGCSPISVNYDYDPDQDFRNLRNWSWATPVKTEGRPDSQVSDLTRYRVRGAVEGQLESKGYKKVDKNPDFLVQTYVTVGQKLDVEPGYGLGWYGTQATVYDEGTLVIDVISAKENRLIWRGTAEAVVDPHSNQSPQQRNARIHEAVQKTLEDFPPSLNRTIR